MAGEHEANAGATIRREIPNAIDRLLGTNPSIGAVAFNGTGARRLHDHHFARRLDLTYLAMPSTSLAHCLARFRRQTRKMDRLARNPGHYRLLREGCDSAH
jgi:hypothetical protein